MTFDEIDDKVEEHFEGISRDDLVQALACLTYHMYVHPEQINEEKLFEFEPDKEVGDTVACVAEVLDDLKISKLWI